ncbi:MAG: hypothetical protein IPK71_20525 [Myxococcales bacterium]|nr:hypothetical protein [Myxococcales bacterium]
MEWIFAVPHTTRARCRGPSGCASFEKDGARNPSFAAGGNVEMATMTAKVRAAFLGACREALRALRSGVRDVFFPLGTWR